MEKKEVGKRVASGRSVMAGRKAGEEVAQAFLVVKDGGWLFSPVYPHSGARDLPISVTRVQIRFEYIQERGVTESDGLSIVHGTLLLLLCLHFLHLLWLVAVSGVSGGVWGIWWIVITLVFTAFHRRHMFYGNRARRRDWSAGEWSNCGWYLIFFSCCSE